MPASDSETLVRRAANLVYANCKRVLRDDQDAADCTQEVLARWWRERDRIRVSAFGWMQAAAHGAAVDMIRRREARRRAERHTLRQESPIDDSETNTSLAIDASLAELGAADRSGTLDSPLQTYVSRFQISRRSS